MFNSITCVIYSIILFIMGLFKRAIPQDKKTKQGSLVCAVSDLYSIFTDIIQCLLEAN